MRPQLPAALVLAGLCACNGGLTNGPSGLSDGNGIPIGGPPGGGTDGGNDGGADGGADAGSDAGCVPLSLNTTGFIDGCVSLGNMVRGTGSVSVDPASCAAQINTGTGTVCVGTVHGAQDAFDGGCNAYNCQSPSLPGTITCITGPMSSCTILVCDAGGC